MDLHPVHTKIEMIPGEPMGCNVSAQFQRLVLDPDLELGISAAHLQLDITSGTFVGHQETLYEHRAVHEHRAVDSLSLPVRIFEREVNSLAGIQQIQADILAPASEGMLVGTYESRAHIIPEPRMTPSVRCRLKCQPAVLSRRTGLSRIKGALLLRTYRKLMDPPPSTMVEVAGPNGIAQWILSVEYGSGTTIWQAPTRFIKAATAPANEALSSFHELVRGAVSVLDLSGTVTENHEVACLGLRSDQWSSLLKDLDSYIGNKHANRP